MFRPFPVCRFLSPMYPPRPLHSGRDLVGSQGNVWEAIAMTAPVVMTNSEKIAMTAPVAPQTATCCRLFVVRPCN